jgi:hypothetical protein
VIAVADGAGGCGVDSRLNLKPMIKLGYFGCFSFMIRFKNVS